MAWIQRIKRKDGSFTYWVRDRRDGRQISIDGGRTRQEADMKLEQYRIRRDLEKEGYGDRYENLLDDLWGQKQGVR